MSPRIGGRRLLWRVYLYGIVMLVSALGVSLAVGRYVLQPAFEVPLRPSTTWLAWHAAAIQGEPERLSAELSDLRERVGIEVSLFERDGRRVITSATEPPPPLSPAEVERLASDRTHFQGGRGRVAIVDEQGGLRQYALVRYPQASPFGMAAGQLVVALLVLALLAVPLARSIALPVERLARLTRAFGAGDLSVRAGFSRRGDEIGDLSQAFDEMAARIAALRRTELELLANVSHELRTPLSRIRLALELIRDGDTRRASGYVEDIAEELVELEQLIDDVMATARLDLARGAAGMGLPPLRRENLPGRQLLDAVVSRFQRRHPERTLECQYGEGLPALDVDPVLMRRALDNLLDNAVKFSEPGARIRLEAASDGEALEIAVIDLGMGIAAHDLERVFEPFYRTDRSRDRSTGGVGLGLALARRIVEAHAGRIRVVSEPGEGSRFVIRLAASPGQRTESGSGDRPQPPASGDAPQPTSSGAASQPGNAR